MSSPIDILTDLGERLRGARLHRNLTQIEAAAAIGVSQRTYQDWEAGRAFPQIRHRTAVAAFLDEKEAA